MALSEAQGIALGGFMGTGKSTVGPILAKRLSLPFVDLDHWIEAMAGMGVEQIFSTEGEAGFRKREQDALRGCVSSACVVSLGGGTLHYPGNVDILSSFRVLVLHAPWSVVHARLKQDATSRPLVEDARQLYLDREEGYAKAGTLVPVDQLQPAQVVNRLLEYLGGASA